MNKFKFGNSVIYQNHLYLVTAVTDDECFLISEGSYDAGIWADASKLTPATDWVKCSERMPEDGSSVLVVDQNGIDLGFIYDGDDWFLADAEREITHWMPLPAPPQD